MEHCPVADEEAHILLIEPRGTPNTGDSARRQRPSARSENTEVRLLGTGGWLPTDERETACMYVRSGPDVLLLDAGTGARRLITEPALLKGVERLHVVLSHFHLDHVMGLVALAGLPLEREIWMPARLLAGLPADEVFERLVDPPFFTGTDVVGAPASSRATVSWGPSGSRSAFSLSIPGKTIAVKVDGRLVYCTDTAYDAENIGFARGASILLHESFWPGDTTDDQSYGGRRSGPARG